MLLLFKDGRTLQAPGDVTHELAQSMIGIGEAKEIGLLKVLSDLCHSSTLYAGMFKAGSVLAIPKDIPEGMARELLLRHRSSVDPE